MASIIYVTDKQMIEFHRLNGNTQFNFWRPSSSKKKFTDFHEGDLLFFLAKGTERGLKKEKGIVGYGKYIKSSQMEFEKMWKKYKSLNGYSTKKELYEAIVKISKTKEMPTLINCLELKDIVFFQSPLYLSDIDINISNKLESYFYLDRGNTNITAKVLKEAEKIGIDAWSTIFHTEKDNRFKYDSYMSILSSFLLELKELTYTKSEYIVAIKYLKQLEKNYPDINFISEQYAIQYNSHENKVNLYLPLVYQCIEDIKLFIGHILLLRYEINVRFQDWSTELVIISENKIKKELLEFLESYKIKMLLI